MTAARRLAESSPLMWWGIRGLIGADKEGTLNRLKATIAEVIDPKIAEHRGAINRN